MELQKILKQFFSEAISHIFVLTVCFGCFKGNFPLYITKKMFLYLRRSQSLQTVDIWKLVTGGFLSCSEVIRFQTSIIFSRPKRLLHNSA